VGKTSVAAATARACAAAGKRTVVLSTDPAHSLADALETPVGSSPTAVGGGLFAQQVSAQEEIERNWSSVQGWMGSMLVDKGVNRIAAEELSVPPGGDELFALLQLKSHVESGDWDVIVVDCAPTGETLRLLSFPDVARWWLDKVFGRETALLAAARPLARTFLDVNLPDEKVFAEVQTLIGNLVEMDSLLRSPDVSLRLVMTPDRMVVNEAMRTFTYLNLYGYLCDAVVVNRVFPSDVGAYFDAWRGRQSELLSEVKEGFAPVPVLEAPYFSSEVVGDAMLERLSSSLFSGVDPASVMHSEISQSISLGDGQAVLRIALPFVEKAEVSLKKVGGDLVVRIGDVKRTVVLPAAVAGFAPSGASFEDGALVVTLQAPVTADV
jgi:arsenite-transporting ATPase